MTTPLATIADALIEFILSLLRDPAAAAQFAAEPEETLAEAGLSGACAADVRAVVPVVVDRPDVVQRPVQATPVHPGYSPQVSIQQPQSRASSDRGRRDHQCDHQFRNRRAHHDHRPIGESEYLGRR